MPRHLRRRLRITRGRCTPRRRRQDDPARATHEDERLQARREPGPALLTGRLLLEAHHRGHLRVHLPDGPDPQRAGVGEVRRRARVRTSGEALRQHARDRPHRLARTRRLQRHRQPLPREGDATGRRARLPRQGQAGEQAARPRLRRDDDPSERPAADRGELAGALQEGLRNRAVALVHRVGWKTEVSCGRRKEVVDDALTARRPGALLVAARIRLKWRT